MSETRAHRRAKTRAAGLGGRTEVPLPRGQRLDALTKGKGRATEVERSGSATGLRAAAKRLKLSGAPQKVLQVPQKDMSAAGGLPLTQSTTGSCTTRMGPLLGTASAATEKLGRTSPSTKVAKAARRRMGRRAT